MVASCRFVEITQEILVNRNTCAHFRTKVSRAVSLSLTLLAAISDSVKDILAATAHYFANKMRV